MRALVIGAGVSGLSSALRLLEAGHAVEIWARDFPPETTSAVAAAIWYPYKVNQDHRVMRWGEVTLRELVRLSGDPETGVVMRDGLEVFREEVGDPWWGDAVRELGFRRATGAELPAGYADGYAMCLPVADMSVYIGWLVRRVVGSGGRLVRRSIASLGEVHGAADVVVHCTGLGAREVAGDCEVLGVRGQVRVVRAPEISGFFIDDSILTYVIPRVSDVVLGGTAEEDVYDTTVDAETAASIQTRCAQAMPQLGAAAVIADRVGIRPCRSSVRLEVEMVEGARVIHNYGHGGSGVTLSWGCAEDVVRLV